MIAFLALGAIASALPDQQLSQMTALYEQVCKAFPEDKAVESLMTNLRPRELTPDEVKITMRDDPARGWELKEGTGTVWLELPPVHACSVRWNAPAIGDLNEYRALAARYESATGKFEPIEPLDGDEDGIHFHAVGEQRILPDQGTESLSIFDQHFTDPKRSAAGETGVSLRFVHQFAPPAPTAPSSPGIIVARAKDQTPLIMLGFMAVGDEASLRALETAATSAQLNHGRAENDRHEREVMVVFQSGSSRSSSLKVYRDARAGKFGVLRLEVTVVPVSAASDGIDLGRDVSVESPGYISEPGD